MTQQNLNDFFIWGVDDSPYGPVELPTLVNWIKDERVLADTWVFTRRDTKWQRAADITELKMFFGKKFDRSTEGSSITPGSLRRIKILADLNDAQLSHLSDFMELQRIPQWSVVVRQGDPGDAMYLVLEGELRARVMAGDRETILSTFATGDFFGDIALFDHGPRSADVIANVDSSVLRISSIAFERLAKEAPSLATPFLQATSRTLASRIRADNKRLGQMSQQFSASGS
ncbi:MAG TPA: cyclic nucleotide-binding domain-containing protein [Candidatus Angelobacter sp.]|nr:cyclic nucleotide-binding domain-containing protein [Candidatus Angelobacter sp.]